MNESFNQVGIGVGWAVGFRKMGNSMKAGR